MKHAISYNFISMIKMEVADYGLYKDFFCENDYKENVPPLKGVGSSGSDEYNINHFKQWKFGESMLQTATRNQGVW